ncbi:hypothetical protein P8C59_006511 [Phyllachora maydis]|uniref:Uncharacterized protein n=1 Tax=Phyllachora maydis TaxID=1825666 RepID=A0AAD9I6H0_9PEZI|nr:hypothetical protein P8C59_006511 [Phyllachora maydis]
MYTYIACSPYYRYYYDSLFTNLLITNIDSFSNLDNSAYTILAPIPAKPAKITPAVRYTAAYKAKQRKSAKACAIAGRTAAAKRRKKRKEATANTQAYKLAKKEDLRRSKRTAGGNTGRYTTNSGLTANKDDNNAYNRAYMPPAKAEEEEEEEGGSSNNNSVNSSTNDSADKGEGSSARKRSKGASRCKDTPLYKQQRIVSYPYSPPSMLYADLYVYYIQVVTAGKGQSPNNI